MNQLGVRIDKATLELPAVRDAHGKNPAADPVALGDYAARNVIPRLQRVPGVGQALLFGTERAMRIWVDPAKLRGLNPVGAGRERRAAGQNARVSAGALGALPNLSEQTMTATVVVNGQLVRSSNSATWCCANRRRLAGVS